MSALVKVLVEGYTNADMAVETGDEKTQPTVTLVIDEDIVMVVDPGILESQQVLIDALSMASLRPEDVNFVCITHSHLDHYRNIGMFPNAKTLEYFGIWDKNSVKSWSENFSSNIQVARTPGHDRTSISIFVNTEYGVVAICGDVFWKENYPEDDTYATDPMELRQSRELVLRKADWIIPGHGGIYKSSKSMAHFDAQVMKPKEGPRKNGLVCRKCHRPINRQDRCICRPWLCFRCCECGLDCELCGCSHKK